MRAMHNPSRMRVIEELAKNLVELILNECPQCSFPGYDISKVNIGLPCKICGLPTRSTLSFQYKCVKCNYFNVKEFPNGKENEDPQFCDYCNP